MGTVIITPFPLHSTHFVRLLLMVTPKKGRYGAHSIFNWLYFLYPDYVRPTPPSRSGYHRYQFRLYEQPAHEDISLSPEEAASLGSWHLKNFVEQFRLGSPVASTQFLTQHYND
uniref:Uncharacterized protein n=1 Tax=Sphenodon punctatus TaxID=8508 RepID=A0A8D0GZ10_SPHPU